MKTIGRFLRALQRMEAGQQGGGLQQEVPVCGAVPQSLSGLFQKGSFCPVETPILPGEAALAVTGQYSSEQSNSQGLAGAASAILGQEPTDLGLVIQRLRQRSLPGRQPSYCQMAAHILEQLTAGTSAVLVFLGFSGDPPPTGTVAPLAAVLGEAVSEPILALDARPNGPELADCFGLACRYTLKEVLAGQMPWYEAVRKSSVGQLFLLAGNQASEFDWANISEAIWRELICQLRKHYRLILIDGGWHPHPGQKLLLAHCDGVYLVVHLGRTPKRLLHTAVQELQQAGAQVLGCIAAS